MIFDRFSLVLVSSICVCVCVCVRVARFLVMTFLAALMLRLDVTESEGYDKGIFAAALVFLNGELSVFV